MVGADPAQGQARGLSIGRVLDVLKADFPDVTISKIRFLEAEGLVTPARTASGYRSFSAADVERLRFVLTAQRDRFWPLKVIREALDARDRGLAVEDAPGARTSVPVTMADPDVPTAEDLAAPVPDLRVTRGELAAASGLEESAVDALVTYGLLTPDAQGHFDGVGVQVATAAAGLAAFGLEPRHLRPFRTAADREIGLVDQVSAAARRRSDEAGRAVAAEVVHHCIALHTALVKAGLQP